MAEETVVTGPESTPDAVVDAPEPAAKPESDAVGGVEVENRIPISRAEEMWRKREEKARAKWEAEVLGPIKAKNSEYEKALSQVAKGQIEFARQMGVIPPEQPPKPVTQEDIDKMFTERMGKIEEQNRMWYHQQRIAAGWETVKAKYPASLVANQRFQQAVLHSYSQNPDIGIPEHADAIRKEMLEPYATERADALRAEKDKQLTPDRRVVPSGRGAAGGSGSTKTEPRKSVAQRIQDRLKASKEE